MDNNIITLRGVSKKFKDATVLSDINLSFEKGKIYGIIGRNGSGKTVMFKCIVGFMPATEGEIIVNGKKVSGDHIPDNIGTIIEAPGFLPNYSGYKNLLLLAKIRNKIGKKEIIDTIKLVGLDPYNKKHVKKYSLGMRQRLGIAQAITEDPDILILDEPFNGLDNQGVADMRKLFLKLKDEGKTIIMTSHNTEDIKALCEVVYEMDNGKLIS